MFFSLPHAQHVRGWSWAQTNPGPEAHHHLSHVGDRGRGESCPLLSSIQRGQNRVYIPVAALPQVLEQGWSSSTEGSCHGSAMWGHLHFHLTTYSTLHKASPVDSIMSTGLLWEQLRRYSDDWTTSQHRKTFWSWDLRLSSWFQKLHQTAFCQQSNSQHRKYPRTCQHIKLAPTHLHNIPNIFPPEPMSTFQVASGDRISSQQRMVCLSEIFLVKWKVIQVSLKYDQKDLVSPASTSICTLCA